MFCARFNPQANGIIEALNGRLKEMLAKITANFPEDWDLPAVLFAYRKVSQWSTEFTALELLFGSPLHVTYIIYNLNIKEHVGETTRRRKQHL